MRGRILPVLAWSLCGLAGVLVVAFSVMGSLGSTNRGPQIGASDFVLFWVFLTYIVVGAIVASRRPGNPIGWLLLAEGLLFSWTGFALAYVRYGLFARPGSLPGGDVVAWTGEWLWIPEFFAVPALFFLLFPDGRLPSPRWRPVLWLIVGVTVAGFAAIAFSPGQFEDSLATVRNPFGTEAAEPVLGQVGSLATALGGPVMIATLVSFALRFRASRDERRRQLRWVAYAAVLLVAGVILGDVLQKLGAPASVTSNFWVIPVALLPVAAGIAVLRYHLYGIDVVIDKTVVLGGLAVFITAVYVAVVIGIGAVVGRGLGSDVSLAVVATALAAVAFQPVRQLLHRAARRHVFGPPTPAEASAGAAVMCLGAFRVFRDGDLVPLTAWQSKKARTMLKILVARRGRATTRDYLMEALWPEDDPGRLANRLSVALATVRSVLDPDKRHDATWFVEGDKDAVRLNLTNLPVDVEAFLALAERGLTLHRLASTAAADALREAEVAYVGDFLEEDIYEEWAIALRDEARSAYTSVARALAQEMSTVGDDEAATRCYLRILERDRWDEGAHLGIIETLERAGRHGEARRRYAEYVARMTEVEVPAAPFPATSRPGPTRAPLTEQPQGQTGSFGGDPAEL